MKPGIPWSVKGIDQEAREAAKLAARRSGMTIGEWLNSLILESAEDGDDLDRRYGKPRHRPQAAPVRPRSDDSDIARRLDLLADQLRALSQRDSDTAVARFPAAAGRATNEAATLKAIIDRLEAHEQETAAALGVVHDRLETVAEQVAQPQARFPQRPEEVPGYAALEGALRNIVDHIEVSETRTHDAIKSLQDRFGELAARTEQVEVERPDAGAAIAHLDQRLGDLAERLERNEATRGRELQGLVGSQVAKLSERIEAVRQACDGKAERAQAVAVEAARREVREAEQRLRTTLAEVQRGLRSAELAGPGLARVEAEIDSLNQRFDDIKSQAAADRDLQALKLAVEQLAATVAQGPNLGRVADLDRRLSELGRRLDERPPHPAAAQVSDLGDRVRELDQKLRDLAHRADDRSAKEDAERHIIALGERITAVEQRLDYLATIEQSVSRLARSIEDGRAWAEQAAEQAASRAAARLLAEAGERQAPGPSPELVALEQGLQAVRASAELADKRTQETLEAVHETLEQIVDKLTELEAGRASSQQVSEEVAGAGSGQATRHAAKEAAAAVEAAAFPAGPGGGWATPGFAAGAATGWQAPGVVPEAAARPEAVDPAAVREDFIAAARRAAQTAAPRTGNPMMSGLNLLSQRFSAGTPGPVAAQPAAGGSRLSSPFLKGLIGGKSEAAMGAKAATDSAKRHRLIVAGLVLLAAVSAYGWSRMTEPAVEPQPSQNLGHQPEPSETVVPPAANADADAAAPAPVVEEPAHPEPPAQPAEQRSGLAPRDEVATASLSPIAASGPVARADLAAVGSKTDQQPSGAGQQVRDVLDIIEPLPPEIGPPSLRQAAARGDASAQFIVAGQFLAGKPVAQDAERAARWYERAASQGLAVAQYRLGTLYERGRGVAPDPQAARLWYERAAKQGNVKAMHNLAVLAADGSGNQADYQLAARWFRQAAERRLKDSQYNFAVLSERGLGTPQSHEEAMLWYSLAAAQGDADAAVRAKTMEASLAVDAAARVKQRIAAWTPTAVDRAANYVTIPDPSWDPYGNADGDDPATASAPQPLTGSKLIRRAQELLVELGYEVGSVDGVMGARTADAVRLFQLRSGVTVNGMVTNDLVRLLEARRG